MIIPLIRHSFLLLLPCLNKAKNNKDFLKKYLVRLNYRIVYFNLNQFSSNPKNEPVKMFQSIEALKNANEPMDTPPIFHPVVIIQL